MFLTCLSRQIGGDFPAKVTRYQSSVACSITLRTLAAANGTLVNIFARKFATSAYPPCPISSLVSQRYIDTPKAKAPHIPPVIDPTSLPVFNASLLLVDAVLVDAGGVVEVVRGTAAASN